MANTQYDICPAKSKPVSVRRVFREVSRTENCAFHFSAIIGCLALSLVHPTAS